MRPPRTDSRQVGQSYERRACRWLERHGLRCLRRNYVCRVGEIDLIMDDAGTTVFVEVRFRSEPSRIDAASSVGPAKQRRLVNAARHYLATNNYSAHQPCRFDVIAIDGGSRPKWITNAI